VRKLLCSVLFVLLTAAYITVDAHVGKALFHQAISALPKKGKTVILVTHALHFLSACDYIYNLVGGVVAEQGTYNELLKADGEFARLDREFGGNDPGSLAAKGSQSEILEEVQTKSSEIHKRSPGKGTLQGKLIVKEARNTGTIPMKGRLPPRYNPTHSSSSSCSLVDLLQGWQGIRHSTGHPRGERPHARQSNHQFICARLVAVEVGLSSLALGGPC
jgi:hypothetical protein